MTTWWFSFADKKLLGVAMVDADDPIKALEQIDAAGQNPGGQVAFYPLPALEDLDAKDPARADLAQTLALPRLKLMTRAELEARVGPVQTLREAEAEGIELDAPLGVVCEECNRGVPHTHKH